MLRVDCSELSGDLKLAIASRISGGLGGAGVALLKGNDVVIDQLPGRNVEPNEVRRLVEGYLSSRKDRLNFRVEGAGDVVVVHSVEPVPASRKKVADRLPPNVFLCPVCGFVAPSGEKYEDHLRLHDIMRGIAR